jgi:hypothetical protein
MLFALIIAACAAAILTLILVVILNLDKIKELFQKLKSRNQGPISQADKDAIGFTLKDAVANENTPVVEGIFNKKTNQVIDGVKIEAESIAPDVLQQHRKSKVVLYS